MTKEEFISKLTDKPCQDALDEFDEFSKDYDVSTPFEKVLTDFFSEHPNGDEYFWWCWKHGLPGFHNGLPEEFKSDELINKCIIEHSWYVLSSCSDLLSDEVFKKCALDLPDVALECCSKRCEDLGEEFLEKLRSLM